MKFFFYICLCLGLIILQTVFFPIFPLLRFFYDIIIPLIVFLVLYRPFGEGLTVALLLGIILDNISGSPFGLYITIYFWLFIGLRIIIQFTGRENKYMLSLLIGGCILLENLVFILVIAINNSEMGPAPLFFYGKLKTVVYQVILGLGLGYFNLLIIKNSYKIWENLGNSFFSGRIDRN